MFKKEKASLLHNANLSFSIGDFRKSIELYGSYIQNLDEEEKDLNYLKVLQNLGVCHKKIGDSESALSYYKQVLDLSSKLKMKSPNDRKALKEEQAKAFSNMAVIYKSIASQSFRERQLKDAGDKFKKAEELFDQAIEIDLELEDLEGVASDLLNLGNLYLNQLMNARAMGAFERSIAYSERINNKKLLGAALCGIGNVHMRLMEFDDAISKYQAALTVLKTTAKYDTQWLIKKVSGNSHLCKLNN